MDTHSKLLVALVLLTSACKSNDRERDKTSNGVPIEMTELPGAYYLHASSETATDDNGIADARLHIAPFDGDGVPALDAAEVLTDAVVKGYESYADRPLRPSVSPDGLWVAYADAADDRLYAVSVVDGSPVPLSEEFAARWTWSPDGAHVAVQGGGSLVVVRPDGSDQTTIAYPGSSGTAPVWSEDGSTVALADSSEAGTWVWRFGMAEASLFPGTTTALSPDGATVAAVEGGRLLLMQTDGSAQIEVEYGEAPQAVPGTDRLLYTAYDGYLRSVRFDGSGSVDLTTDGGALIDQVYPSPDGTDVLWNGSEGVSLSSLDGSSIQPVYEWYGSGYGYIRRPAWSEDHVAFQLDYGVYTVPRRGGSEGHFLDVGYSEALAFDSRQALIVLGRTWGLSVDPNTADPVGDLEARLDELMTGDAEIDLATAMELAGTVTVNLALYSRTGESEPRSVSLVGTGGTFTTQPSTLTHYRDLVNPSVIDTLRFLMTDQEYF